MQERVYKTQAIVLRRFDFGETGRQLIAFTPDFGKISLIAKGTKKPTSKLAGQSGTLNSDSACSGLWT